ncbi:maleylpyruvate isomerase family mycothiol-dependent enzyme [Actinomadura sp. 21ATH]|uniref:maleylpyruvate isomerase family mycothiol-dependent enzyme n=1 Tax=Actinomadura sp. 21ATH TaxID=1735444 RepID=UPI0035BF965D
MTTLTTLSAQRLAEGLREETGAFAGIVAGADPAGRVPTCPEWSVKDLVEHVGNAFRWTAGLVESRAATPESLAPLTEEVDPADWAAWLTEGAGRLADAGLREAGTEVWTFLGPRPAIFWPRRILHDLVVHHADAALALGAPYTVAPDVAADTISEGLELLAGPEAAARKPELGELRGTGERLLLRPDAGDGWLITRTPQGVDWTRGTGEADVVLEGTVTDLLLVFSRRNPLDGSPAKVTGDRALLEHWLARTAF